MSGTPIRRTIPVWVCILSLISVGCAANRSSVTPDSFQPNTFHSLSVIPTESVPEINVVRMGNSRVVGALQGAGRKDQPLSIVAALRAEIVRTTNEKTVFIKTIEYRSTANPPDEWVKDDFLRVLRALDKGVRDLAKRWVDDILFAGLVPIP